MDQLQPRARKTFRQLVAILICLAGFSGAARAQFSVTIDVDAGALYNSTGTAYVPQTTTSGGNTTMGGLLQLIASPVNVSADGVFTAPTSANFITGNDILVKSFTMNYNFGAGEAGEVANFAVGGTSPILAGYALELRWYPTLTVNSAAPGMGATYGAYRSDSAESQKSGTAIGIPWFVPSSGGTVTYPNGYDFNTMAAGGTNLEQTGWADDLVVPVPEPSYVFIAGGLTCLAGWRLRNSLRRASGMMVRGAGLSV